MKEKPAQMEGRDRARTALPVKVGETVSDAPDTIVKGNRKGKENRE